MARPKRKTSIVKKPKSLKPQNTRKLIRRFHVLLKARAAILAQLGPQYASQAAKDALYESYHVGAVYTTFQVQGLAPPALLAMLGAIDLEIRTSGGLETYQVASQQGQSAQRGSDSSKKLVEWLRADGATPVASSTASSTATDTTTDTTTDTNTATTPLRSALEIGCLSPQNHIATSRLFSTITRVDLHSQHPLIIQSDFMDLPVPPANAKYDLVSCSLVLNFVPTPLQRGAMLKRITQFLRPTNDSVSFSAVYTGNRDVQDTHSMTKSHIQDTSSPASIVSQSHGPTSPNPPSGALGSGAFSPAKLFVVLPLPCVSNSRYFDQQLFGSIMTSLGFVQTHYHESHKLAYWLFDWVGIRKPLKFKKQEIHTGKRRNNFCIVMD